MQFQPLFKAPDHARTSGASVGMKMPTPIMAKLLKKPKVMMEKSSMGMNMVERASAPRDSVKPMDMAVMTRPMMMGPAGRQDGGRMGWDQHGKW